MTTLTIRDRLAIYRAIGFAQNAADVWACAYGLTLIPVTAEARAAIDRAKCEGYFCAAFAWHTLNPTNTGDRERSALNAGLAERAAIQALDAALDDIDPGVINPLIPPQFDICVTMHPRIRAEHEDLHTRYIEELPEGMNEGYARAGAELASESDLTRMYSNLMTCFPTIYEYPLVLEDDYLQARNLMGDAKPEYIAYCLAAAAYQTDAE